MAVLTERCDKAIAINLLGRKVLLFDETGKSEWFCNSDEEAYRGTVTDYKCVRNEFVRVPANGAYRRHGYASCTLGRVTSNRPIDIKDGMDDYFYLSSEIAGISSSDWYTDYIEFAEKAKAPLIEEGDKVSIVVYDRNKQTAEVHCVIAKDIGYSGYSTCGYFVDEAIDDIRPLIDRELRRF